MSRLPTSVKNSYLDNCFAAMHTSGRGADVSVKCIKAVKAADESDNSDLMGFEEMTIWESISERRGCLLEHGLRAGRLLMAGLSQ